eukprot:COSAG05_NODE_313_length_11620_cov_2.287301_4_plen_91_part_00
MRACGSWRSCKPQTGCLVLSVDDVPFGLHANIARQCQEVYDGGCNPGNDVLERIPQLQQVFDSPTVSENVPNNGVTSQTTAAAALAYVTL